MSRIAFMECGFSDTGTDFSTLEGIAHGQFFFKPTDFGGGEDYPFEFDGCPWTPMKKLHKWFYRVRSWQVLLSGVHSGTPWSIGDILVTQAENTSYTGAIRNELDFIKWLADPARIYVVNSAAAGQPDFAWLFIDGASLITQNATPFDFKSPMYISLATLSPPPFGLSSRNNLGGILAGNITVDGLSVPMYNTAGSTSDTITGTIDPIEWWTYNGIYDPNTGAQLIFPLPRNYQAA